MFTNAHMYSRLLYGVLTASVTFVTVHAVPTSSSQDTTHQKSAIGTDTRNDRMSTEAIIGIIGVVVAVLGIASSLAWSKRRKSRSGSRRSPTPDGAFSCCTLPTSKDGEANMEAFTQN